MKKLQLISTLLITSLFSSNALFADHDTGYADDHIKPLNLLVTGGYDFGGDRLLEIEYFDGSEDIFRVGQGFNVGIGGEWFPNNANNFSIRGTAGVKYTTNRESNVDANLFAFPLEISANWKPARDLRIGIGYVEHLNPQLDSDLGDTHFQNASGPKYEIAYRNFALTYTNLDYIDDFGFEYNADSLGISYSISF